jgi:hypothetical protein
MPLPASMDEFERLEQFAKLQKPPVIKFKDLDAVVKSEIRFNTLPMKVRVDYIKITDSTVLTPITLQFDRKDLSFQNKDGVAKATINIYGRITSMSRRVVNVFEEPVSIEVAASLLQEAAKGASIYQKTVPLAPGMYRLNVVAKDIVSGNMVTYEVALNVPHFEEDKLASSTLILADTLEKVPTRSIGAGQFVIGDSKVRPRLNDTFKRDEKLGIYAQFYNFEPDEKTHKPNGSIEYEITKAGSPQKVMDYTEDVTALPGASAQQVTVEKLLPLDTLQPGQYTLTMKVTDKSRNQTVTPTATFTVQ